MRLPVAAFLVLTLVLTACADEKPKPLSEPGERLYTVRGTILSRDGEANTLHVDHEEIPGFMAAMKMDYAVRGASVATLPADNNRIEAQLHVTDRAYWITNVKQIE